MDQQIRDALVKCLTQIQQSLGRPVPVFHDELKPIKDIEDFNSELWPIASGMLQVELKIRIPGDVNIFREPITKTPYSIAQIVANVASSISAWTPVVTPTMQTV